MIVEKKLEAVGLSLPDTARDYAVNASGARFVSHLAVGNMLYVSGTCAMKDGKPFRQGVVGADLSLEQGYEAARYALLPTLGVIKYALGDLDRVQQAVQMLGFVNSSPTFSDQPRVINGATDLLVELYGDRGKPTRAAIGCRGLALNHSVEVVLTVLFAGSEVRPPLHRDARESEDKGPSASLAPSAAGSTYSKYASPAAIGRRLAAGPFSSL